MKKLMIVAAIVCVAAFAHAGAYTWGLTSGEDLASNGSYLTDVPFTVMLFTGSIGETSNGDGTYALNFSGATYITQTSNFNSTTYTIGEGAFDSSRTNAGVDGSAQAYSILVLDTGAGITDYANYNGTYAIVNGTGAISQDKESSIDYSEFKYGAIVSDYHTAASIPEPTSGLLLLIGVAGMALRRRRA